MESLFYTLLTVVFSLYAQLIFKARATYVYSMLGGDKTNVSYILGMISDPLVATGFAAGLGSTFAWFLAIQQSDVGYAYPFLASTFVLVPVGARIFLDEPLPPLQLLGGAFIVVGLTLHLAAR